MQNAPIDRDEVLTIMGARIARLREMAEKGEAELARKRAAEAERPQ